MNFKTFRLLSIISFIVALILGVLSLFNQNKVICSLFGYQCEATALALIIIWAFIAGALYAGIIGLIIIIKNRAKISDLKKVINEMKEDGEEE